MTDNLSPATILAVHAAIRHLATQDGLGKDAAIVASISRRAGLTSRQADALRKIIDRHRDKLPSEMLEASMVDRAPPEEDTVKRTRGRPRIGEEVKSQTERTREWRSKAGRVSVETTEPVASRLRRARVDRGLTVEGILNYALDAMEHFERDNT